MKWVAHGRPASPVDEGRIYRRCSNKKISDIIRRVSPRRFPAGMTLRWYRIDGLSSFPGFQLREPARSAQRILIWLGVRAVDGFLGITSILRSELLEASAEVGEWYLRRRPNVQENIRSRFLV